MMFHKNKTEYYSLNRINKTNSLYNLIIGQRSNGKTYACLKQSLDEYVKTGKLTVYIRRYAESLTPKNIKDLFNPFTTKFGNAYIEKITNGEFNHVFYRSNTFYLAYYDSEKDDYTKKADFGFCYTSAINTWENCKGADKGIFKYIIFDEFMTRETYLQNEFIAFLNIVSSYIRDRDGTIIYMLGNTVSKYCPYFNEFGIKNIDKMKKGEIQIIKYDESGLQLAVEYCDAVSATRKVSKYFAFNNPRLQMITGGEWEIPHYPHCYITINNDNLLQRLYIKFDDNILAVDIASDGKGIFANVHLQTHKIKDESKQIIYCKDVDTNMLHCHTLRDKPTKVHELFVKLILQNKIFFTSNDVGEIFQNFVIAFTSNNKNR